MCYIKIIYQESQRGLVSVLVNPVSLMVTDGYCVHPHSNHLLSPPDPASTSSS